MSKMNAIGWFDIFVTDLDRAVAFYQAVLGCHMDPIEDPTGETQIMSFPADMTQYGAGGALSKSAHAGPGVGGTIVYFNCTDCAVQQDRVQDAGGQVVRPKFSIGAHGFVSLCMDTEGNMFGLSSMA
ncbi:lactoylglutathione lyase [Actibacterium mucosum KCTC 23349]|uniref:Lactoylglutathione lyase n=1 Tax=Actibacterium mucosum KCTC 23349 TaxID=1454373 RepID=A0A037ZHP4_9RHOB|nr:VOC family protein [Actibacterium mucosum]KAJ55935.1 lactoylglutathione lyase [Actibacterium mucosum KCTC 23349]